MPAPAGSVGELLAALDGVIQVRDSEVQVLDEQRLQGEPVDTLAYSAVFGSGEVKEAARWLLWATAQAVGLYPASIHDLYMAAGRGEYDHAATRATNVRGMAYDDGRTLIQVA